MLNRRTRSTIATCAVIAMAPLLAAPAERSYASGNFALTVAGVGEFFCKSFGGGAAVTQPTIRSKTDGYPDKSPGQIRYEDAQAQVGFSVPKELWAWIGAFASPSKPVGKEVTLTTLDYKLAIQSKRQFGEAMLSKVVFPACDATSKEPAYVDLSLTPTRNHEIAATGKPAGGSAKSDQKAWLPVNYRLSIDGIDTTRVNRIEPITIRHPPGGSVEYSNLVFTMAESTSASLKQWMNQVLDPSSKGNAAFQEKAGTLELLSVQQTVLLRLRFEGLGPVKLAQDKAEANADTVKRVTAELYVEKITIVAP